MNNETIEKNLKGRFPFRLGTTSYIMLADIVTNAGSLVGRVDDVEIVIFDFKDISSLPSPRDIQFLLDIAEGNDLTYTIHLPLDSLLGDMDESIREGAVEMCLKTIFCTAVLNPFGYIIHLEGDPHSSTPARNITAWAAGLEQSIVEILNAGVDPRLLCVETLNYPFELVEGIVHEYGLSVCLDIGHILENNYLLEDYLECYLPESRIIHLYGPVGEREHGDLSLLREEDLSLVVSRLLEDQETERVLTLEVFSEDNLNKSLELMEGFLE